MSMSNDEHDGKSIALEGDVRDMKIKEDDSEEEGTAIQRGRDERRSASSTNTPRLRSRSSSQSLVKPQSAAESPVIKGEHEETIGGDITLKLEPGKAPKLS
ncbi:hypothetical protein LTR28_000864, partial [Elasticomyces elasticus]